MVVVSGTTYLTIIEIDFLIPGVMPLNDLDCGRNVNGRVWKITLAVKVTV
jgi:hypothetical protein